MVLPWVEPLSLHELLLLPFSAITLDESGTCSPFLSSFLSNKISQGYAAIQGDPDTIRLMSFDSSMFLSLSLSK